MNTYDHRDNTGWKNSYGGKVKRNNPSRRPKRKYTAPIPAKQCVVSCRFDTQATSTPLFYDFEHKLLSLPPGNASPTILPSRRKAKSAIWHRLEFNKRLNFKKFDGTNFHDDDFEINNVQEAKP